MNEQRFALFGGYDLEERLESGIRPISIVGCYARQGDALLAVRAGFKWWCIVDMTRQVIVQEWPA